MGRGEVCPLLLMASPCVVKAKQLFRGLTYSVFCHRGLTYPAFEVCPPPPAFSCHSISFSVCYSYELRKTDSKNTRIAA
jgi:hypothetical protein